MKKTCLKKLLTTYLKNLTTYRPTKWPSLKFFTATAQECIVPHFMHSTAEVNILSDFLKPAIIDT